MSGEARDNASNATSDAIVRASARTGAPDRYVAALLAPASVREDLIALAAFSAELEKIPLTVSEPHLGEIRIQWWRDALSSPSRGEKTGNPVADAFSVALLRHGISGDALSDYFDASVHGLYGDAPPTPDQLRLQLDMTEGTLFALAARILGVKDVSPQSAIVSDASQAYGLTKLALNLPYALSHGRSPLPDAFAEKQSDGTIDWARAIVPLSDEVRQYMSNVERDFPQQPKALRTALLPLAVVKP